MLDRLVDVLIPNPPGADGGLTGGVTEFRIVHERRSGFLVPADTYLIAMAGAVPSTGAVAGQWLANSVIRWTNPLRGRRQATFNRPVSWTANTLSLRYGEPWRAARDGTGTIAAPAITTPDWFDILATYGTAATATIVVDVSAVLVGTEDSQSKRWAELLDETYVLDDAPAPVDSEVVDPPPAVTRVVSTATYRMRWDVRMTPFSTITDGNNEWLVVAVRRQGARGRFMEVDVSREFYGTGR